MWLTPEGCSPLSVETGSPLSGCWGEILGHPPSGILAATVPVPCYPELLQASQRLLRSGCPALGWPQSSPKWPTDAQLGGAVRVCSRPGRHRHKVSRWHLRRLEAVTETQLTRLRRDGVYGRPHETIQHAPVSASAVLPPRQWYLSRPTSQDRLGSLARLSLCPRAWRTDADQPESCARPRPPEEGSTGLPGLTPDLEPPHTFLADGILFSLRGT